MSIPRFSTLRSKLIVALLGVALMPLSLLALLNQQTTRRVLIDNANQTLLAAAAQTALNLDGFIKTNLDAIRVEAQLPKLDQYLMLQGDRRSKIAAEVEGDLRALSRKDTLNLSSYALLNLKGQNVLDTYSPDLGRNESKQIYFQQPLKTGLPYVSPLLYSALTQETSLYFSSPVRNATGTIVGILRVRYQATVIQRIISQNSDLAGDRQAFAILLDENHIRLTQSNDPELAFKAVVPLSPGKIKALQLAGRLPPGSAADLSTNLPEFDRGLTNMAKSPYFTAPVDAANSSVNAAAVVMLKTQPWYVVFVQPQSELLALVNAQIRNALGLVLIVTGLIIVMAVLLARQLTQSLTELANTVTQFASGDLTVRTSIHSKDEIGLLADNFNAMSEQVEQLLKRLEKRTLELEISQQVTMSVGELSRSLQDPQRLLQEAIAIMQSRFGLNAVRIYLLDRDTHQLIQRASSGESGMFCHQPDRFFCNDAHSTVARAAQTQTTILVNDANPTTHINPTKTIDPITNHNQTAIQTALWQPEIGSEVAIPLVNRGNLLGVLDIQDEKPHRFSELDLETFNTLSGQIAAALENAYLFEQVQQAEAQFRSKAQQLEDILQELQQTQAQLIQTEKMSSLGQLVAGVAHEINNPINFVYANIAPAHQYLQDLMELLRLYQHHYPSPAIEIQSYIEQIDLKFLIEDFEKLLSSMQIGADRIRQIVLSLRNFSRLDEAAMKPVDIHDGIDSTLLILQNRLRKQVDRPEIQLIKEYGDLPQVECYAGQLNQVFMNILSNAIDALEEQNHQRSLLEIQQNPDVIRIRTEVDDRNWVMIRIADNGTGMTESIRRRLFDPFFTTKPVGSGTGLGLSISYQIVVNKHGGELKCLSVPGEGTEFFIKIPIQPQSLPQSLPQSVKNSSQGS